MSVTNEAIDYILSRYFTRHHQCIVSLGKSGYNNTTRFIQSSGETYILRIYETHKDEGKVKLEHDILIQLNAIKDLPFKIPLPLKAIDDKTFIRIKDGSEKIACMYYFLEGDNPVLDNKDILKSFGERTAQLLKAFENVKSQHPLVYRPYYEIENTHPNCPIEKVIEGCNHPPMEYRELEKQLRLISEQLLKFQESVPGLKQLPHQLIHGDLNASNMLSQTNRSIDAILDFEFITSDLRVMEVAVCLSEIIIEESDDVLLHKKIRDYMNGFSTIIRLLDEEIQALPLLIQLRRLDVFVHFLGRHLDGIHEPGVLREQIIKASIKPTVLQGNGIKLVNLLQEGSIK